MMFGYFSLILVILFICMWFFLKSTKQKAHYRNAFFGVMVLAAILYINRIFSIAILGGYFSNVDLLLTLERTIYYFIMYQIYGLFTFFIFNLLDQVYYYPKWKTSLIGIPLAFGSVLILSSPWTELVFYVQEGVAYTGRLYPYIIITACAYPVYASVHAYRKRKLLPRVFGESVMLAAILNIVQYGIYLVFHDESMFSVTIVITVLIYVLALTIVEFYKDNVTKLLNREAFAQYVRKEIGKGNDEVVYLIKMKNYQYLKQNCHEISLYDTVANFAECLKSYAKLSTMYYLGDGKFTIIVQKRTKFVEEDFLKLVRERCEIPFDVNGASIQVSIFVAIMNLQSGKINGMNFAKYFTACDEMKYRSNELIEVIQGDSFGIDQLQRYHQIEEAIDRALVEHEFKVFYQPIISTKTKKIVSAEALLRLNDRILGFISPEEFIPISESNGKIIEISDYVIDQVFRFVKEHDLTQMGLEFVEMNLSMIQCMDSNLPSKLKYFLEKYQISPNQVNLEITETATNYDEERLKKQLETIKKLGFSFSLDDYGTGYSNLVRVLEYPVDLIKLDKSIVWSAFHIQDNFVTLKNLVAMFHDVRRKLVAEGVESEEQMKALVELGCDYLQGYYYSKPIGEEDFLRFTAKFNA